MKMQTYHLNTLMALALLLVAGCASKNPYHTENWTAGNCVNPDSEVCAKSYYQEYPDYDLAFVEFSERGNTFNSEWVDNVLEKIRAHAQEDGVVVVTFIHGWKHNAKQTDSNLVDFRKSLAAVANSSSSLGKRRLVGLYIGWRGASLDLPVLKNLTFWDRKAVAEEVGKGGVTSLLLELDRIDRENAGNVMVVIGHSFGGAIVVSATTEVLAERAENQARNGAQAKTLGDLIIVLNPAIEANQSLSLIETALHNNYPNGQTPLFISLSSDADWATHYTFPAGQTLGLLLTWHQHDLQRERYYDRLSKEHLVLKEEHLDATAVGNFAPYLTHRLSAEPAGDTHRLSLTTCEQVPDRCVPEGWTTLSGHPTFGPLPENYPLHFIKTDKSVMKGHNDIFNPVVRAFILGIIDDVVARSLEEPGRATPSILFQPDKLNTRFKEFYSTQ
ncbi:MAG TPA: alpha/beta hydrolase [Gammaproteobacteria bacterium]|nr:alpha/beta hydrolase [Gammaproteobacteria bacterium]